ncbi:MAG: GNAT family N-acetyltransferase [Acidimicrobiales bacterium]|nr:GNAT family N-acetyltransferase [Acidimicrobiales bacterium]
MTIPVVETERLLMRGFTEADLPAYSDMMRAPEVRDSLRLPDTFDEYAAWEQLVAFTGQWVLRGTGQWAVVERESGRLVGRAGTHHPHRRDWPGVEVGWTFHPSVWGRGYATEAGGAAVDWAFSNLDVDVLHAMIHVENPRSMVVARRLGFTLVETRTFAWYPELAHGRWELRRPRAVS